jgi:hypothetical protein
MIFVIFGTVVKNILVLKTYLDKNFKSLFFISYEEAIINKILK